METVLSVLLLSILSGLTTGLVREHFHMNIPKTWPEAKVYCKQNFRELSIINSENENLKLQKIAGENGVNYTWIGLRKVKRNSSTYFWEWSNKACTDFRNWELEHTEPVHLEDCVAVQGGNWLDFKCDGHRPFFCYDMVRELILVQENKTWEEALEHCRAHHTDLASLTSKSELLVAEQKSKDAQTPNVWTGLCFLAGEWLWVNGEPLESLSFPEGALPQCPAKPLRCGARNSEAGHWENRDCEERLNFICYKH